MLRHIKANKPKDKYRINKNIVRAIMEKNYLPRTQINLRTRINHSTILRIEQGLPIRQDTIYKFLHAFNLTIEEALILKILEKE
jgi:hypothetical protein